MRLLFGSCFTFLIAAALGLGATWFTLTRGVAFGSLSVGAWTAWPKSGSVDIDPYARASIARSGELPTGMGDGVAFYAHTDDQGSNFDGRCTFTISGMTPAARYWTVTLYDPEGRLVANTIDRHGFTSDEIVRDSDGHFTDHRRAAGARRQLAADRRHRAIRAGLAALRHADRRRHTHDQGRADARDRAKGLLMIRAGVMDPRRDSARRHRPSLDRAGDAAGGEAGRLFAAGAAHAGQHHGAARRADGRQRHHAVHGSGLCRGGVPLRSDRAARSS